MHLAERERESEREREREREREGGSERGILRELSPRRSGTMMLSPE